VRLAACGHACGPVALCSGIIGTAVASLALLRCGARSAMLAIIHPLNTVMAATAVGHPTLPPPPAWAAAFRPGVQLQALVDRAIQAGDASVALPAGNFSFGSTPFTIRGAINLRVRGRGPARTSLWFDPGAGVEVISCVNTTVEEFSMDTVVPAFSQGVLKHFDDSGSTLSALVEIEDDFPAPMTASSALFNETCPDGSAGRCGEIKMIYWDPETRRMVQGQQMNNPIDSLRTACVGQLCNVSLLLPVGPSRWLPPPGSLVTFSPRCARARAWHILASLSGV
jgi:hypothetical protein